MTMFQHEVINAVIQWKAKLQKRLIDLEVIKEQNPTHPPAASDLSYDEWIINLDCDIAHVKARIKELDDEISFIKDKYG